MCEGSQRLFDILLSIHLLQAMSVFALRDINMTKIESRPLRSAPIAFELDSKRRSYNYLFFIDFNGSTAEVRPARFQQSVSTV